MRPWRLIGMAGLIGLAAAPPPADSDEILVVAKLKVVQVSYVLLGSHVRTCWIDRSSGDPSADQLACALVRLCVNDGALDRDRAAVCVNDRLKRMDRQARASLLSRPEILTRAPVPPAPALPVAVRVPAPAADRTIVVEGRHPKVPAGLWRFQEIGSYRSRDDRGDMPLHIWRVCLSANAGDFAFDRILELTADMRITMPGECRRWVISGGKERFSARRTCMIDNDRMNEGFANPGDVRTGGRLSPGIRFVEQVDGGVTGQDFTASRSGHAIGRDMRTEWSGEIVGRREGECRAGG